MWFGDKLCFVTDVINNKYFTMLTLLAIAIFVTSTVIMVITRKSKTQTFILTRVYMRMASMI